MLDIPQLLTVLTNEDCKDSIYGFKGDVVAGTIFRPTSFPCLHQSHEMQSTMPCSSTPRARPSPWQLVLCQTKQKRIPHSSCRAYLVQDDKEKRLGPAAAGNHNDSIDDGAAVVKRGGPTHVSTGVFILRESIFSDPEKW